MYPKIKTSKSVVFDIISVYIDVLFLVNFVINSYLTLSSGVMLRHRTSILRLAIFSCISALYSSLMFFPITHFMYTLLGRIAFTVLFVMLYFKSYTPLKLLKALLVFIINSLMFFCIILFLSSRTLFKTHVMSNGVFYADIDVWVLLIMGGIAYVLVYFYMSIADRNMSRRKIIYDMDFLINGKYIHAKVLCDTGCELTEPISNKPILLLSPRLCIPFLAERYAAASTVGGVIEKPIPLCRADKIDVCSENVYIDEKSCYIGFSEFELSSDSLYDGIANPYVFNLNQNKNTRRYKNMLLSLKREAKTFNVAAVMSEILSKIRQNKVHYIGGADTLPAPYSKEEEAYWISQLKDMENAKYAAQHLAEHNLRLVVYIAKKFDSTGIGIEDLISIGTIGLIKAINTFKPEKNIKLATYASRCIENEILMYLRKNGNGRNEVSIDEPLNVDWDGNELLLSDILGTDENITQKNLEDETDRELLYLALDNLTLRERNIVELRYGINKQGEKTQKEVADMLGISQSYISRLEKRIISRLRRDINRMINS